MFGEGEAIIVGLFDGCQAVFVIWARSLSYFRIVSGERLGKLAECIIPSFCKGRDRVAVVERPEGSQASEPWDYGRVNIDD